MKPSFSSLSISLPLVAGILQATAYSEPARAQDTITVPPEMVITLTGDATVCERHAADELAKHLDRMLGHPVPVLEPGTPVPGGWTLRLEADPTMGSDSFHIQIQAAQRVLRIAGGRPRGVLMGVYSLLADHLGCRWYTPDIDYVPTLTNLVLPADLDHRHNPEFEYRHTDWAEARDPDWAARNRLNAGGGEKHGGGIPFSPFVHTFDYILSPAAHFDAHPEYFAFFDGKRQREATQLCLSNTNVLNAAIARAREWAATLGGRGILSVSQNDYPRYCECPDCAAIDTEEGSHSGTLIRFVNNVAQALEVDYPNVAVETLAYLYSRTPCKTKPRPNVIVRLCSIECCFSHALGTCDEPESVKFMKDITGWSELTDRLYVWDYTTDFCQFLMPFPNMDIIDDNMRMFVKHGVVGMFPEGNPYAYGEFAEMRTWMLVQLMWNPDLDAHALQEEFARHVYGPCADAVLDYLAIQREALAKGGDHLKVFDYPDKKYLNPDAMGRCDAAMEAAEAIAMNSGDAGLIKRIHHMRMSVWFAQFHLRDVLPSVKRNAARRLTAAGREFGITQVCLYHDWPSLERDMMKTYVNYPLEAGGTVPVTMHWGATSDSPFLGSILFRDGANTFGVWDTGFDDNQGTMEAWVYCGEVRSEYCKGWGSLFEIRETNSPSGHRVWIDVDTEKGEFVLVYESWTASVTNRITGQALSTGAWHHVSATWDSGRQTMNLYADANAVGQTGYSPTRCAGEKLFHIGADLSTGTAAARSFGPIDEVRISRVARQPALQSIAHVPDSDTLLLLNFDEPAGTPIILKQPLDDKLLHSANGRQIERFSNISPVILRNENSVSPLAGDLN